MRWTDASRTVRAALLDVDETLIDSNDAHACVMIGDTRCDVIVVRCGGWRDAELGAADEIYDGPRDLLQQHVRSILA